MLHGRRPVCRPRAIVNVAGADLRVSPRNHREWRCTVATDPVCHMQIDESKAAGKSDYNGKTYYFCAVACKKKFDENPQKYAAS
jgi:YHS domain-containing protein